ncbi:MAG: MgtC/SapB family protein [Chloroflexi bacterium]|nr:MgtC/SapB family protein [Chloroflexota bacterium]
MTPIVRLALAVAAGALVGLERTYNGRPAGFRTHALVATASSLLMLFTVFQFDFLKDAPSAAFQADPTRMAQGIMTGIGFLGAGVIVKEGITVRGLTTAASIWMTAAIGILIGVGFYVAAGVAEVLTLGTLSGFRYLETFVPTLYFGRLTASISADAVSEEDLRRIVAGNGMRVSHFGYGYSGRGRVIEYSMTIQTRNADNFRKLANALKDMNKLQEFRLEPGWE